MEKLEAFFGFIFLCSLVHKPRMRSYWSNKKLTATPGMRELFTRDEFLLIKKNIKFFEGQTNEDDIFYRVRPLINQLISNTNKYYSPPEELSLDESMIAFKGRSKMKVYMPLKPTKYGFKVYTLTAAKEPIIINFSIYDGISRPIHNIVSELVLPYKGKGHKVFMDRFYSSPFVFKTLENLGFGACGTCMSNRLRLTQEMITKIESLLRGQHCYFKSQSFLLCVWKDAKTVYLLSTIHHVSQIKIERRLKKKDIASQSMPIRFTEKVLVPECVNDYNMLAKGVDLADQIISYYSFAHRNLRWYWSIVHFLLEVASLNSYTLYQKARGTSKYSNYHDYRRELAKGLVNRWKIKRNISSTPLKGAPNLTKDIPVELLANCFLAKGTKRVCFLCKKHKSNYECGQCNVSLCILSCYDLHRVHTESKIYVSE